MEDKVKSIFQNDTYNCDLELFKELGLTPFNNIDNGTKHFVGRVMVEENSSYVDLYVTCFPAQFWREIIFDQDTGLTTEVSTGSGSLNRYWPTFKLIAEGFIAVENAS